MILNTGDPQSPTANLPISHAIDNGQPCIKVRVNLKAASASAILAVDGKTGSVAFNNIGIKTTNVELWGLTAPHNPGGNDG